jgi:F-type H+-transporting ATPase subunit b
MQVIYFAINFIIFVIVMYWLLRKPVSKFLRNRKDTFIKESAEAKTYYDTAFNKLNEIKGKLLDVEKDGEKYIDDAVKQAKEEAKIIIVNAKACSGNILTGSKDVIVEEIKRARNRQVINFVHDVVAKTRISAEKDAVSKDYNGLYMKDYLTRTKENRA